MRNGRNKGTGGERPTGMAVRSPGFDAGGRRQERRHPRLGRRPDFGVPPTERGAERRERVEPQLRSRHRRRHRHRPERMTTGASRPRTDAAGTASRRPPGRKRRSLLARQLVSWVLVLGIWCFVGSGRRRGLLRARTAAHRPARRAETATQHRHPGRGRLGAGQSRRYRRGRGPPGRPASLPAQGLCGHRGPAVLFSHYGIDPVGIAPALVFRNVAGRAAPYRAARP